MNCVMIASRYSGDTARNVEYAKLCMKDALRRGEAPFASHLLYPGILDDTDPAERQRGMQAGWEWMSICHKVAFYTDLDWSQGMFDDLKMALVLKKPMELRTLYERPREAEPLDVMELISHAQAVGLTVVYFGDPNDLR